MSSCCKTTSYLWRCKWTAPLTVKETVYAQSLTDKPVKGMLTGPVTILNWSFERVDVPRKVVQDQIALKLLTKKY